MHVAGGHYRFVELVAKLHDLLVDFDQVFLGMNGVVLLILDHEHIVSKRLDFQIIVEAHQSCDLLLRRISKQSLVKLSRLAGASDEKSVPVRLKNTLRHTGPVVKIFDVGLAYQLVQIDSPGLVAHENNRMVGRQLLDGIRGNFSLLIELVDIGNVLIRAHSHKFLKYACRTFRIVYRTVVMIQ